MPATVAGIHLGPDTHANRPAANAAGLPVGALYLCSTHSLIYITNGSSWSTWATLGGVTAHSALTGLTADDHTQYLKETDVAAKGDLYAGTANDTVGILTVGTNTHVLTADSAETTGMKWAAAAGGGAVATDAIWDAAGDLAVGSGANTAAKLTLASADRMVLQRASGAVAWGYAPFIGCKAYNNTSQGSLAASTVNALTMNAEDFDTSAFHDNSTNPSRFTIPITGYYRMRGGGLLTQAGNFYWRVDGTTLLGGTHEIAANTAAQGHATAAFTAGQYVELVEFHGAGTATAGHASARHVQIEGVIEFLGA